MRAVPQLSFSKNAIEGSTGREGGGRGHAHTCGPGPHATRVTSDDDIWGGEIGEGLMNEESPAHTNSSVEVSEEVRGHGVLRTSSRASLRGRLFLITLWACTLVMVDGPKGGGLHTAIPECDTNAAPGCAKWLSG